MRREGREIAGFELPVLVDIAADLELGPECVTGVEDAVSVAVERAECVEIALGAVDIGGQHALILLATPPPTLSTQTNRSPFRQIQLIFTLTPHYNDRSISLTIR